MMTGTHCLMIVTLLPDDQTVEKEWILDVW